MIVLLSVAVADDVEEAEAHRLSVEIANLEGRGIWSGVERAYRRAVATNEPLDVTTHIAGARAALQAGDADTAEDRLRVAYAVQRTPELLDWLRTFSRDYSRLRVRVDPGAVLEVERRPFHPDRRRVLDRAEDLIERTQEYDGMMPVGRYRIGSFWFRITPDGADVSRDLRACVTTELGCPVDAVDPTVQTYVP